jgi:hypothetical protein
MKAFQRISIWKVQRQIPSHRGLRVVGRRMAIVDGTREVVADLEETVQIGGEARAVGEGQIGGEGLAVGEALRQRMAQIARGREIWVGENISTWALIPSSTPLTKQDVWMQTNGKR